MGCGGSKNQVVENNILEFQHKDVSEAKPDKIKKEINELYKLYVPRRDTLKPLLAEKYGINALIDEEREKLLAILAKKDELSQKRKPLMDKTWERDADDIYKAFSKFSADKSLLVTILCARTYWQINEISAVYERKYGAPLLNKVVNELTTVLGSLLTGGGTGLSKLLTYRIMPQPERDAALLRDSTDGMSLDDAGLLEIICTRTNIELKQAMIMYTHTYKKDLVEIVKNKSSYKNYREFVLQILECNRDETNTRFDITTAKQYAQELYAAGAGRTIGFEPEPFIRILSNISIPQFESINDQYPNKQLIKDIQSKLGGDFQMAVLTRCTDKYEYFANRIETALRGFSPDKETLCRILGCLSRPDCVKVKLAYNRAGYKRTLDEAIRTVLKGQVSYLTACLMLISEDMSLTPLASDKEISEEELELSREADRVVTAEMATMKREKIVEKGESVMIEKRRSKRRLLMFRNSKAKSTKDNKDSKIEEEDKNEDEENTSPAEETAPEAEDEPVDLNDIDPVVVEEDRILNFSWDGKGRFMDAAKLTTIFRELEYADNQVSVLLDRIEDENKALMGVYRAIIKHRFETEAYIRIYTSQIKALQDFSSKREELVSQAMISAKKK